MRNTATSPRKAWTSGSHPYRVRQDGATPYPCGWASPPNGAATTGNLATAQRERLAPDLVFSSVHSLNHYQLCGLGCPAIGPTPRAPRHGRTLLPCGTRSGGRHAPARAQLFTISETMRRAYYERYGRDSQVFHNGAERGFITRQRAWHRTQASGAATAANNLLPAFPVIEDIAAAVQQHTTEEEAVRKSSKYAMVNTQRLLQGNLGRWRSPITDALT